MLDSLLLRSESDLQAIDVFIDADLAAESAVVSGGVQDIEHLFFFIRFCVELMITEDIDVATSAEGHTSAGTEYGQIMGLAGFHDIEPDIGGDFEVMDLVIVIDDFDVNDTVRRSAQVLFMLRGQK